MLAQIGQMTPSAKQDYLRAMPRVDTEAGRGLTTIGSRIVGGRPAFFAYITWLDSYKTNRGGILVL